jgi:hypothetical protein
LKLVKSNWSAAADDDDDDLGASTFWNPQGMSMPVLGLLYLLVLLYYHTNMFQPIVAVFRISNHHYWLQNNSEDHTFQLQGD